MGNLAGQSLLLNFCTIIWLFTRPQYDYLLEGISPQCAGNISCKILGKWILETILSYLQVYWNNVYNYNELKSYTAFGR